MREFWKWLIVTDPDSSLLFLLNYSYLACFIDKFESNKLTKLQKIVWIEGMVKIIANSFISWG